MRHSLSAGIHQGAYIQSADPSVSFAALLQPNVLWIDTTTSPYSLKKRNAGNTAWDAVPLTDAASAPFVDSTAIIKGSADPTKLLRFEVDGFTGGATRVLTPPNYDGTIATLAGTETFTNKSLDAALVTTHMDFTEVAAPGTPASGKARLYVKADGLFYGKDDAGVETVLSGGGGGGSPAWSAITDPSGNLSLAMAANISLLTWAGNYSGSAFKLVGSHATPTGALLHVSTAGSTLMPPLLIDARGAQRLKVNHLGDVVAGQSGIGGGDADGYLFIPLVASNAFPSATPTGQTGFAPIVAYSNGINTEFGAAVYAGGAWRDLTGWRKRYDTSTGTGSQNINWNSAIGPHLMRQFTFGAGNAAFTFTNDPPAGTLVTLLLVQDATGSRTATWESRVKWAAGLAPTLTPAVANARDLFTFAWDGSNYWEQSRTLNAA